MIKESIRIYYGNNINLLDEMGRHAKKCNPEFDCDSYVLQYPVRDKRRYSYMTVHYSNSPGGSDYISLCSTVDSYRTVKLNDFLNTKDLREL